MPFAAPDLPFTVPMTFEKWPGSPPTMGVARHLSTQEYEKVPVERTMVRPLSGSPPTISSIEDGEVGGAEGLAGDQ